MIARIKQWTKKLKVDISAHKLTLWYARLIAMITVGYVLSPVDLIPDFIPMLGFVDDAILLPTLIWLSLRLIPKGVIELSEMQLKKV